MTLDQLLTELGVTLARDSAGAVASHMLPNPLPAVGTVYAVVTETTDSLVRQGHGYQERRRLALVMLYGAAGTVAGKRQLDVLLAHLRRRAGEVDRWPGLRLQPGSVRLADASPTLHDAATQTHYAGQRLALTYVQST